MSKYLLCIPLMGLADSFNQICRCINYCKKSNRILLIYTKINSQHSMNYKFDDFFVVDTNKINCIYKTNEVINIISNKNLSVNNNLGKFLDELISGNYIELEWCYKSQLIKYDSKFLKFDLNNNYNENILVYCSGGGGNEKIHIFDYISLTKNTTDEIYKNLNKINEKYISIYVRNTDIKSNYVELYENNKNIISKFSKIYVASDDKNVIDYFKQKNKNILNFTTFPDENDYYNLHYNTNININTKMLDMISDLIIVGFSTKIIVNNYVSGFRSLCLYINQNKKYIYNNLFKLNKSNDVNFLFESHNNFIKPKITTIADKLKISSKIFT